MGKGEGEGKGGAEEGGEEGGGEEGGGRREEGREEGGGEEGGRGTTIDGSYLEFLGTNSSSLLANIIGQAFKVC